MQGYPVLLVEDDPNDVLLIQRAFKNAEIVNPIHVVEDGEQALYYLSGEGGYSDRERFPMPLLILLDLKLPRKSGMEVLAWIRSQKSLKRLPVVVLTSSRENHDINRAYDIGANSYLVKPGAFEDLMEMMKAFNIYWMIMSELPDIKENKVG
ncbi:MAG: response regulator [Actinomycetota bacterium]|nr:response regulator [Actinomycetota bacterium]